MRGPFEIVGSTSSRRADRVWILGGTFRMESDKHYAEEAPVHRVTVDGFWIDRRSQIVKSASSSGAGRRPRHMSFRERRDRDGGYTEEGTKTRSNRGVDHHRQGQTGPRRSGEPARNDSRKRDCSGRGWDSRRWYGTRPQVGGVRQRHADHVHVQLRRRLGPVH